MYDNISNYLIEKKREIILDINSGFIIGSEDFMYYIENIYFKELIENDICNKELVELENINEGKNFQASN